MNNQRVYQLIGLCQKARMMVAGEFATKQAVLDTKAHLVIVATDASNNTKKLFNDKCSYRNIPCVEWGVREDLGKILGKEERVTLAILDEKIAAKMIQMIKDDM